MKENKEIMELKHEPVQGYRKVFFVAFGAGLFYLAAILLYSFLNG